MTNFTKYMAKFVNVGLGQRVVAGWLRNCLAVASIVILLFPLAQVCRCMHMYTVH